MAARAPPGHFPQLHSEAHVMDRIGIRLSLTFLSLAALPITAPSSRASLISATLAQHSGSTNPTGEGFTFVSGLGTPVKGPVTNDLGTGFDAWNLDTTADSQSQEFGFYERDFTAAEQERLKQSPRELDVNVRIVSDP